MNAKWMIPLAETVAVMLILLSGFQSAAAAPAGEMTLVKSSWGNEVPIPRLCMGKDVDWMKLFYDPLVGTAPDGKLSTEHGLCNKWEMSTDGLTWSFHLRKGVKFHDGVEVTAKDVKFTIEQVVLPDTKINVGALRDNLKKVEMKDPYTLIFSLKKPTLFFSSWLTELDNSAGMVIPKDYYERVGEDQFQKHPIGSGPYKWHSQMVGSYIKLEATEKHWRDGVPRYKYVNLLTIPEESTQFAMLKTGEADIMSIGLEKVEEAKKAGLNLVSIKQAGQIVMVPNMQWTSPAFSDIRFRKALNLAIDKEAIIKYRFMGQAAPLAWPSDCLQPCGGDPTLKPYPYDPGEARRLVKEGGYEGYEFTLVSYIRPECPDFPGVIETVGGYWGKIGLKPKIFMTDYNAWRDRWLNQKTQNAIHGSIWRENPDCASLIPRIRQNFHSKSSRAMTRNPELDKMFDRAVNSLDLAEVKKVMGDFNRYVHNQYLVVPICDLDDMIAITKRIPEWNPGGRRNDRNLNDLIRQR